MSAGKSLSPARFMGRDSTLDERSRCEDWAGKELEASYIYIYIYVYAYMCMYVCKFVYTGICIYTYMYTH